MALCFCLELLVSRVFVTQYQKETSLRYSKNKTLGYGKHLRSIRH
jgi:hypothetical protein